jgi:plasmid stabilization system protein ParE
MPVRWTSPALADIATIQAYLSAFNPDAAHRVAAELVLCGDSLALFPERGRRGSVAGTRELVPLAPYVIVYRVAADGGVDILRVVHGARRRGPGFPG